jgi:hypothetical protein
VDPFAASFSTARRAEIDRRAHAQQFDVCGCGWVKKAGAASACSLHTCQFDRGSLENYYKRLSADDKEEILQVRSIRGGFALT